MNNVLYCILLVYLLHAINYHTSLVFFFFNFIEHKDFWQNAKSKCVFLLSSVSLQYLHRHQWTDRQRSGTLPNSGPTCLRAVVYREKSCRTGSPGSITVDLLAIEERVSCLTEYEAVGCYAVVRW